MNYTIEKITTLIGARRYGSTEAKISFLLTDSRSLCFSEETLFFAIKTKRNDGHRYIDDLYRRGVRNFVVEELPEAWETKYGEANFLKVVGVREALQRLAERHRDEFYIPVVGITGSNGKTIVKEWLYQILSGVVERQMAAMDSSPLSSLNSRSSFARLQSEAAQVTAKRLQSEAAQVTAKRLQSEAAQELSPLNITRSPRSYNSQIGVPLSVWLLDEQSEVGIFEAGISKPGEMKALRSIIQPTVGVLTNLGAAHQENFSSMEAKCREKMALFHDTKAVVYCMDDEIVARCISQYAYRGEQLSWSMKNPKATFYVKCSERSEQETTICYIWKGKEYQYRIPFIDEGSIQNSITCAVVALHLGLTPHALTERMPLLEPVAMRLEVKEGQYGCILINDSYNSDVYSLDIALDFMNRRPDQKGRKRTLILSDIEQSGIAPATLYQSVSELAQQRGVEKFIGIGPQLQSCQALITIEEKVFFGSCDEFIYSEAFRSLRNELILLKGARRFGFDQLTELLVQKVHETTLEVNLNAVVDNLNYYRSFLNPETKLVCMIKADGYGAGAVEIAKTLQEHRVDYLAVAVADEGVTLRKAGITSNIMIMNPEMTSFKTMFDYELEPEVYSFRLLDALIRAARQEGITGWPVHIKLDTGMHRLGFNVADATGQSVQSDLHAQSDDISELITILKNQQAVIPRSVFSHFVGSDSDVFDSFSAQQFVRFKSGADRLQEAFEHHIIRHMDNSAGIEHFPARQMDMCRLGLGLYGVNPRNNEMLHNVSTLKTTILQLRHVPAGDSVGYSRRTILDKDSIIGAIPIGYADGLNRHLGNRHGFCLVNGKRAEYVGNICMDVAMIDVTDIDCKEGDSVEIFGDNLPVTSLSDTIDTIPYEVLTGISNRVKRVYFHD